MTDAKPGLGAALEGLEGAHTLDGGEGGGGWGVQEPDEEPRQLALLGDAEPAGTAEPAMRQAGPGRPAGARNKRTGKLAEWILAQGYRHPAIVLAELAAADVVELAAALDCKRLEAADLKRKAATDLLPYFESKMPTAVEIDTGDGIPVLNIGRLVAPPNPETGIAMSVDDVEENQTLSDDEAVRPADEGSHDVTQASDNTEETGG